MLLSNDGDKEFIASFLYYSWPLLVHPNKKISTHTQECWWIIIQSTLGYLCLAHLESMLLKAEQHMKECIERLSESSEQEHEVAKMTEWTNTVNAEHMEDILLEEHISYFVQRIEERDTKERERWNKERQEIRKQKASM